MKKIKLWLFASVVICSACGQTGPLILPIDENSKKTTENNSSPDINWVCSLKDINHSQSVCTNFRQ